MCDFHVIFKVESKSKDRSLQRHVQSLIHIASELWPWVIVQRMLGRMESAMAAAIRSISGTCSSDSIGQIVCS